MKALFLLLAMVVGLAAHAGCEDETNKVYGLVPYTPGSSFLSAPAGFEGFVIGKKSASDSATVSIPQSAGSCGAKLSGLSWVEDTRYTANSGANKGVAFVPSQVNGSTYNPKSYNMYVMQASSAKAYAAGTQLSHFTLVGDGAGAASPCTELQSGQVKTYWKVCAEVDAKHL